eukprot:m.24039 g.24039  ORF g.24039 m.24039 type:complete len:81 (-) comp13011_c0_seq3:254-496(-)
MCLCRLLTSRGAMYSHAPRQSPLHANPPTLCMSAAAVLAAWNLSSVVTASPQVQNTARGTGASCTDQWGSLRGASTTVVR